MRFGSTAKVLLKCNLKYYRISECLFKAPLRITCRHVHILTAVVSLPCSQSTRKKGGCPGRTGPNQHRPIALIFH